MEAEVVVGGDEEGLEQVALGQRVQFPRDVNVPSHDGHGAAEPEEPDQPLQEGINKRTLDGSQHTHCINK